MFTIVAIVAAVLVVWVAAAAVATPMVLWCLRSRKPAVPTPPVSLFFSVLRKPTGEVYV